MACATLSLPDGQVVLVRMALPPKLFTASIIDSWSVATNTSQFGTLDALRHTCSSKLAPPIGNNTLSLSLLLAILAGIIMTVSFIVWLF